MPDTHRSSLNRRRYRLAQSATVAGSLAVGALVVKRLVSYFRDDFFLFYGVDESAYSDLQLHADAQVPLTLGQLVIAAIALVAVVVFVAAERRRLKQGCEIDAACACRRKDREVVVERLRGESLFDVFVMRTSAFAGLLLAIWLLQSSLERWMGGLGLGIEYASWRSLLPLASVFGVCVLAGMLVASVSLVGMRAIYVLEHALARIRQRRLRPVSTVRRPHHAFENTARTLRELMGCDILSRPPPLAC
jgi:hypothetical protein